MLQANSSSWRLTVLYFFSFWCSHVSPVFTWFHPLCEILMQQIYLIDHTKICVLHYWCSVFLWHQIEKIVLFLLEQQGALASRIEKLGKQRAILAEQPDISAIAELREAYREVGLDLIKLLKFVDLNATGIRKILKKFDKRFGYRFTDYYVTSRSNHPYSQLQQVFKHVVMYWLQIKVSSNFYTAFHLHFIVLFASMDLWSCLLNSMKHKPV